MTSIEDTKTLGPVVARPYYSAAIDTLAADPQSLIDELVGKRDGSQFSSLVAATLVLLLNRQSGVTQSVTEQGAVGDGVTDDTAAIQAAIDAVASAGGGTVLLPPGVFLVSDTITLASGVTLQGSGVPSTILRGDDLDGPIVGTTVVAYAASPTIRAPQVRDLVIDNQDRDTAGGIGLDISGCYDAVVDNVVVQNVETGLRVTNSTYWSRFSGVRSATTDTAFLVTQNANHNTFISCHALATDVGVHVLEGDDRGVSNTLFVHLAVEQFTGGDNEYGVHLECDTANAVDGVLLLQPRLENAASSSSTGVIATGTVRNVTVVDPLLVNIDTITSGLGTDATIRWRAQEKGGVRVGVAGDYSTTSHALLNYNVAGARVLVRSSADSTYVPIQGSRYYVTDTTYILGGAGSPEGVATAPVGCMYLRTDGGASTVLYVKESGTGNTGWVAK
jgi:hypothetical protein